MIDIQLVRKDTPSTLELIHFNNAGASLSPTPVVESVFRYLNDESKIGGYEAEALYSPEFKKIYSSLGQLINAKENEIALMESATGAWNSVLSSLSFQKGDIILTSFSEYISNYIVLIQLQKKFGVQVEMIGDDPFVEFSLEELKKKMSKKVKLIALTHVPSSNGLINQMNGVSDVAKENGAYFLLDACQSAGQMVIDTKKIGCDFLAATGRKFMRAPRGTGFLYANENSLKKLEPAFLDFSSVDFLDGEFQIKKDAKRFEHYETNFAARLGLGKAVDYALALGMENIEQRVQALAKNLRDTLRTFSQVTVHDTGIHQSGIVTFTVNGHDSYSLAQRLKEKKINLSVFHPNYAPDLQHRKLPPVLRASVHYYNTEEEIEKFKEHLKIII